MQVGETELSDPQVSALLAAHQRGMDAVSPPGTSFALDLSGLSGPEITLFAAWDGGALMAVGALKSLGPAQAEIKSMRTDPAHLARGAGRAVLEAIIERARRDGFAQLSLETGTNEHFVPAIALYRRYGFKRGEAFGGYANGPHNQCYHLDL